MKSLTNEIVSENKDLLIEGGSLLALFGSTCLFAELVVVVVGGPYGNTCNSIVLCQTSQSTPIPTPFHQKWVNLPTQAKKSCLSELLPSFALLKKSKGRFDPRGESSE